MGWVKRRSVVTEESKRREGTIGHGACSQSGRFEVRGWKTERDRQGDRGGREREKEVKKQGQYTQRNVVLQTVELAKLKCTVTMGTLGEKEEKKRLTMKYRKRQRQYLLLNDILWCCRFHITSR